MNVVTSEQQRQKKNENNNQPTRGLGWYKAALSAEGKRWRDRQIPRVSLLLPWKKVEDSTDRSTFGRNSTPHSPCL